MSSNFDIFDPQDITSEVTYDVYSAGLMWNWTVSDKLALTNSVRLDHLKMEREGFVPSPPVGALVPTPVDGLTNDAWSRTIQEVSINSGLVYQATSFDTIRVSYARGVRVPNLITFNAFLSIPIGPGLSVQLTGNPLADPTTVQNYELGYDRRVEQTGGKLRTAIFYQEQDNVLGFLNTIVPVMLDPGPPPVIGATIYNQNQTIGSTVLYGAEVSLDGQTDNFKWDVGYTWAAVEDELHPDITPFIQEARTPSHRVVGHIGYTRGDWEFDVYGQYVSDYTSQEFDIDAFARVDARIARVINDIMTVSVTGTNLTGEHAEGNLREVEPKVLLQFNARF